MLRIQIIRSAHGLEALRDTWASLYRTGRHSIFQSPEWNLLAARVFSDCAPLVVHAESDAGAALIPACIRDGQIEFLGETLFDYRDVLATGDEGVLRAAWRQIAAERRPLSITALQGREALRPWQVLGFSALPFCHAPAVRRAQWSPDSFVHHHHKAARAARRLASAGFALRVHSGADRELVRYIYGAKARQPIAGNLFAENPARQEFMISAATMDTRCEVFTLENESAMAGALLTLRDGQVRRFYTIIFEPAWAHYSPGTVLLFEVARHSLAEGLDCDYMTGEQAHKTRFGAELTPLFRVQASADDLARIAEARSSPRPANLNPLPQAA